MASRPELVLVRRPGGQGATEVQSHHRPAGSGRALSGCMSVEMIVVDAPLPLPTPTTIGTGSALKLWDDNGNGRITCAEARRHGIAPVHRDHPAYEYMRDADGDGVVCE